MPCAKGLLQQETDDTVIDLSQHTVLPGLMDMHTHLSYQHEGPSTYMQRFTLNGVDYVYGLRILQKKR